jgi:hypothetical protein
MMRFSEPKDGYIGEVWLFLSGPVPGQDPQALATFQHNLIPESEAPMVEMLEKGQYPEHEPRIQTHAVRDTYLQIRMENGCYTLYGTNPKEFGGAWVPMLSWPAEVIYWLAPKLTSALLNPQKNLEPRPRWR